jgi:type III secretory pathway component EscR
MGIKTFDSHKRFQMEKKFKYKILILLTVFLVFPYNSSSQDIDVDDILNKLERLENNVEKSENFSGFLEKKKEKNKKQIVTNPQKKLSEEEIKQKV